MAEPRDDCLLARVEPPSGFQKVMGYRLVEWTDGYAAMVLEVGPQHLNRSGVVHGAVYMALIDSVCGLAGCYCAQPGRVRRAVSLSLTTSFLGQCDSGTIRAEGRARGGGSRIFIATGQVLDERGGLLALGEGPYRYRRGSEHPHGVPAD